MGFYGFELGRSREYVYVRMFVTLHRLISLQDLLQRFSCSTVLIDYNVTDLILAFDNDKYHPNYLYTH